MEEYLKDISDGKLYSSNDMVKVGCHDCNGCSACCCDMGESILLDPMDVWRLERNLGQSFEQLLAGAIDLHVEDGLRRQMQYSWISTGNLPFVSSGAKL